MTGDKVSIADRRLHALALRREGHPYDVIGRIVGTSKTHAWRLVQEALAAHTADDVADLRHLEGDRLDAAQAAIWPRVLDGDLRAVDTFLRLSARRSRLYGLDITADDIVVQIEARRTYQDAMDRMMRGIQELLTEEP